MTQFLKLLFLSSLFWFSSFSYSDNHAPTFYPVEVFGCKYNEGQGLDDLLRVAEEWNRWTENNFSKPYAAWVLVPTYVNSDSTTNDVAWIGISTSFEDLGTVQDEMASKGQRLQAKFDKVSTCKDHTLWGWEMTRQSPNPTPNGNLTFSACTLNEGVTREDVLAADKKWNEYLDSINSNQGSSRWYPGSGTSNDITFDFLAVGGSSSNAEWGRGADAFVNGGGGLVQASIYGDLMTCDTNRVYQSINVKPISAN